MENNSLVTANVVYKDIDAGNKPVYQKRIAGPVNSPVHMEQYKRYVPKNFKFEGYGYFNRSLKDHDVDVIYVREHHVETGDIAVDYIDSDNQLIGQNKFTNQVGRSFNVNRCKSTIPNGYQFERILTGEKINTFQSHSQIMLVQVSKIKYATFMIKYMDNNKQVGQAKAKGIVGSPFKMDQYVHNVPNGYRFVKVNGRVPNIFQHDQVLNIMVTKPQPAKPQSSQHARSHVDDPKKIGTILMRLASSLHALGETISKNNRL